MRLFLLTSLTMLAFASNSLLTRHAIDAGHADPNSFTIVRVLSGAFVLYAILLTRGDRPRFLDRRRVIGALSLSVYMVGFSVAYLTLDAGQGALILFGVVQMTIFTHAAWSGRAPNAFQFFGAVMASVGLVFALWPGAASQNDPAGAIAMTCAGLGWAVYTISGRSARSPLAATAVGFALCLPLLAVVLLPFSHRLSATGWALAILCGGVTSGLGYALWYSVLPSLTPAFSAVVQLSVPVIAILAGAVFLGEAITPVIVSATVLVLSGIALATINPPPRAGRS